MSRPPWRWVIPVAAFQIVPIVLLALALTHPVPGGVNGCEGPHTPPGFQQQDFASSDRFLRDWSHAKHVRQQLWKYAFLLSLPVLVVAAFGGFVRRHRWVKVQFGLALLCVVVVLFSAHAVDPVYFGGGC